MRLVLHDDDGAFTPSFLRRIYMRADVGGNTLKGWGLDCDGRTDNIASIWRSVAGDDSQALNFARCRDILAIHSRCVYALGWMRGCAVVSCMCYIIIAVRAANTLYTYACGHLYSCVPGGGGVVQQDVARSGRPDDGWAAVQTPCTTPHPTQPEE